MEDRERQTHQTVCFGFTWCHGAGCPNSKHQKKVKLEDNPLEDLLADTLPELEEPDEIVHWTSNKRKGGSLPNARKPMLARPLLTESSSLEDKHRLLKMSKQLHQSSLMLDDWLTELQQQQRRTLDPHFQIVRQAKGHNPSSGSVPIYRSLTTKAGPVVAQNSIE